MMATTEHLPDEPRTRRPWPTVWPEFLGKWPRLTGRQQPLVELWHEGDESEGDRCARFGVRIGLRCMPWEWMIVRAILSLLPANEWGLRLYTHRNVVIECTRQQGKTLILILVILWKLFKKRRRVVYTAQQWTTVEDVFDRIVAVIERVPSLRNRLAEPPSKKDNRGRIKLKPLPGEKHVVKADFGPRTQHFARGFTEIDDLFLDEAYDLVPKETANLTGAQAASDNPQTIYASTPPVADEHANCHRLAGFHRQGLAGVAAALYYALFAAPPGMGRDDLAAYPLAQPSYGVVGNDREMEAYLQGAKTAADLALFDADWLGRGKYPLPESVIVSEISAESWAKMRAEIPPRLVGAPAVGLHFDTGASVWVLTAAQYTDQGVAHLELGYRRSATSEQVVKAVVDLVTAWDPVAVAIKSRGDAAAIRAELEKAGVEPEMVDSTRWSQWCGGFLNGARAGRFSHCGQPDLNDGVGAAVRKDLPAGGFVWDEAAAGSYAAALQSATLAYGALLEFGTSNDEPMPAAPVVAAGDLSTNSREINLMNMAL